MRCNTAEEQSRRNSRNGCQVLTAPSLSFKEFQCLLFQPHLDCLNAACKPAANVGSGQSWLVVGSCWMPNHPTNKLWFPRPRIIWANSLLPKSPRTMLVSIQLGSWLRSKVLHKDTGKPRNSQKNWKAFYWKPDNGKTLRSRKPPWRTRTTCSHCFLMRRSSETYLFLKHICRPKTTKLCFCLKTNGHLFNILFNGILKI